MKVVITIPALDSYNSALRFLGDYLSDKELLQWDEKLWKHIEQLEKFPRLGAYETDLEHKGEGYRRLVVGKFKVIFELKWSRST